MLLIDGAMEHYLLACHCLGLLGADMALMAMQLPPPPTSLRRRYRCSISSSTSSSTSSFRRPQMQVLPQCRASRVRLAMCSTDGGAEAPSPPAKKPFKPHRYFEYRIWRPYKGPNYLLWGGLVFAFLMRGTIAEELNRWPVFALKLWELMRLAKDRIAEFLLLNAKEPFLLSLKVVSWLRTFLGDTYVYIVEQASVPELLKTMVFSSAIASIGEAARSNAADQPWVIGLATVAGLGGVLEIFDNLSVAVLLLLATIISYVRQRDLVVALLPAAAVMVSIGLPHVQVITFVLYLLLAIIRNWAAPQETQERSSSSSSRNSGRPPFILVLFSIAVGINVAVNWLRAGHVVWLAAP